MTESNKAEMSWKISMGLQCHDREHFGCHAMTERLGAALSLKIAIWPSSHERELTFPVMTFWYGAVMSQQRPSGLSCHDRELWGCHIMAYRYEGAM